MSKTTQITKSYHFSLEKTGRGFGTKYMVVDETSGEILFEARKVDEAHAKLQALTTAHVKALEAAKSAVVAEPEEEYRADSFEEDGSAHVGDDFEEELNDELDAAYDAAHDEGNVWSSDEAAALNDGEQRDLDVTTDEEQPDELTEEELEVVSNEPDVEADEVSATQLTKKFVVWSGGEIEKHATEALMRLYEGTKLDQVVYFKKSGLRFDNVPDEVIEMVANTFGESEHKGVQKLGKRILTIAGLV